MEELAEGEDPGTTSRQQAERWVFVYQELVQLEDGLIKLVKERLPQMSREARQETERTNLPTLEGDAHRFHERLAFWRERLAELDGSG